jgi:uncharacterized membrane protein YfcA
MEKNKKLIRERHIRKVKWALVVLLCLAAILWSVLGLQAIGYVQSWGLTVFRALSGAFLGWLVSRYVLDLRLMEIPEERRPLAALSQAIIMGSFTIGMSIGV